MLKIVGLDLDGILIGLPPIIPKQVIDYLYKDHSSQKLAYRIPGFLEQKIRQLSHLPGVRPPIFENVRIFKEMKDKNGWHLYIITGRFGFLNNLTYAWLKKYDLLDCFEKVYLNTNNLQPHLFKEEILNKVKIDMFIDDDFDTIAYLAERFKKLHFYWYTEDKKTQLNTGNITTLSDLSKILK